MIGAPPAWHLRLRQAEEAAAVRALQEAAQAEAAAGRDAQSALAELAEADRRAAATASTPASATASELALGEARRRRLERRLVSSRNLTAAAIARQSETGRALQLARVRAGRAWAETQAALRHLEAWHAARRRARHRAEEAEADDPPGAQIQTDGGDESGAGRAETVDPVSGPGPRR